MFTFNLIDEFCEIFYSNIITYNNVRNKLIHLKYNTKYNDENDILIYIESIKCKGSRIGYLSLYYKYKKWLITRQ